MTTEENKREEAYASTHKVLTYKDILDQFNDNMTQYVGELSKGDVFIPGHMPTYYFKKALNDGMNSTLRISNHAPIMQSYFKCDKDKVPTTKHYGNLSIMFFNNVNLSRGQNYMVKEGVNDIITIKDDDVSRFKPFRLHHVHYRTGYMTIARINTLKRALQQWGSGNGDVAFNNPFSKNEHITPFESEYEIKVILKSQSNANEALVRFESGTKYLDIIQLNPVKIIDGNGHVVDSGYVYAFLLNATVIISSNKPKEHEDIEYDEDGTMNFYI